MHRRGLTDPDERKAVSKQLMKAVRSHAKLQQERRLDAVLAQGQGEKHVARACMGPTVRQRIAEVETHGGGRVTAPTDIAETFACFYEKLYSVQNPPVAMRQQQQWNWGPTASHARRSVSKLWHPEASKDMC